MDKSWIEYNNEINLCSYLCSNRYSKSFNNDQSWENVKNKDDFQKYINLIPISSKKKDDKFNYLSLDEINKMTDDDKINYFDKKNQQFYINELSYSINEEIFNEDKRTREIELGYESINSSDDY